MPIETPFWQILTSAGLGAFVTAISSIIILLITQHQTRNLAGKARGHDREMRQLEHDREDAREFSGIVQELMAVTEQWASTNRIVAPLLAKMKRDDLMEWVDTDSAKESRERSIRISDLLIRALLLARDEETRRLVSAAVKARDAIPEAHHDDPGERVILQFKAITNFESAVSAVAARVAQRQSTLHPPAH